MNLRFQELGCDRYHASQYIISSQILESESESLRSKKESPPVPSPIMHSFLFWRHLTRMIQIMLVLVNKPPDNQSFMFTLSSLAHIRCMPGCLIYMPIYHIISILFFVAVLGLLLVRCPTPHLCWHGAFTPRLWVPLGKVTGSILRLSSAGSRPLCSLAYESPVYTSKHPMGVIFVTTSRSVKICLGVALILEPQNKIIQWSGYLSHMRLSL